MRRMTGGLVAALENEKVKTGSEEHELPDHAESLEKDVGELNDHAAEGEADAAELSETEATSEALEAFRVALEGFQQDGGIDGKGAFILHLATEHLLNRVGSSGASIAIPAMENFGGQSGRLQAGTIALENLKEEIQKAWRAIVEAIKKAIAWVKAYWFKVFGAAEKLQRRAKDLQESARQTTGQKKGEEIDDKNLAGKIATSGGSAGLEGLAVLKTVTNAVVTRGATLSGEVGKAAVEAVKEVSGKNLPAILKLCEPIPGSEKIANPQSVGVAAAPEGLAVYGTKELPGDYAIVSWVPSGAKASLTEQIKQIQGVAFKTIKVNKGSQVTGKLKVLSLADAGNVAKSVEGIADELLAYRKNTSQLEAIGNELAAAAEGVSAKAGEEEDEGKREQISAVKAIATAANRLLLEPGASFSKYCVQTCEAYLHYVEKSLKQYA